MPRLPRPEDLKPAVVRARAGARGEEEPRSVVLEGREQEVVEIVDAWTAPEGRWFRVRLESGETLLLLCAEPAMEWLRP